jgi:hypothetical protein
MFVIALYLTSLISIMRVNLARALIVRFNGTNPQSTDVLGCL